MLAGKAVSAEDHRLVNTANVMGWETEEPSYLDFNAMYPAAMTLPMPNGPCKAVALPEDNAARLSWLQETCLSGLELGVSL